MRIDDLRQEMADERLVVSGQLNWEETDREPVRIRFEAESSVAADIECNPNAFLAATAVPAMYFGEKRLLIEGKICPVLRDNLYTVLTQHREWYDKGCALPVIESTAGLEVRKPRSPRRAGQFFSGGIDALTTLRRNRLLYSADHPLSIRDCINVFGMHLDDYEVATAAPNPARVELWNQNLVQLRRITDAVDVELYQLRTNVLGIFDKGSFYCYRYHAAVLLSLAHLLTKRLSDVFLASSDYLADFVPWGSHPLVDPYYSGSDLQAYHDTGRFTRLDKVKLLSDWPLALSMLNVCSSWTVPEQGMNCGKCGKCVRTMTELLVAGKLHEAPTFPVDDLTPELIDGVELRSDHDIYFYTECLDSLHAMGRHDLIRAIEGRFADHRAWLRRRAGRGIKQRIKRIDEQLLGGKLREGWQAFRGEDRAQSNRRVQRSAIAESKNKNS